MTEPEFEREEYEKEQLVVDNRHVDIVRATLVQLEKEKYYTGTPPTLKLRDCNRRLELSLFDVRGLEAIQWLKSCWVDPKIPRQPSPLDLLLGAIRHYCAGKYGGWKPVVGKNRKTKGVFASPNIDTGAPVQAEGYPEVLPSFDSLLAASTEGTGDGQGVRVGILDTRIYPAELLAGRYLAPSSSILEGKDGFPSQYVGHATFVAGCVLRRAPNAELEIRSVLDGPKPTATVWELAESMVRFLDSGVSILNLSLGCYTEDNEAPIVLRRAVELLSPSVVLVAAAGNHAKECEYRRRPFWPAAFESVTAVGANLYYTDKNCRRKTAPFSPQLPWVDVTAPGEDIFSTYLTGSVTLIKKDAPDDKLNFLGGAVWSGTSFAAALLSGAIAARTVPGRRSAQQALQEILEKDDDTDNSRKGIYRADYSGNTGEDQAKA